MTLTTPRKRLAPLPLTTDAFVIRSSLGAPVVADPDRVVASAAWGNGPLAISAQPDIPRNITANLVDANNSITAGVLAITGLTPQGETVTELCDVAAAKAGYVGKLMFAHITSIAITGTTGTVDALNDLLTVGVGNVIGLPSPINVAEAVKHVFLGGARVASPVVVRGPHSSGVDASAATYDGTKELVVFYSPGF